jgi:hypothetical protein
VHEVAPVAEKVPFSQSEHSQLSTAESQLHPLKVLIEHGIQLNPFSIVPEPGTQVSADLIYI